MFYAAISIVSFVFATVVYSNVTQVFDDIDIGDINLKNVNSKFGKNISRKNSPKCIYLLTYLFVLLYYNLWTPMKSEPTMDNTVLQPLLLKVKMHVRCCEQRRETKKFNFDAQKCWRWARWRGNATAVCLFNRNYTCVWATFYAKLVSKHLILDARQGG